MDIIHEARDYAPDAARRPLLHMTKRAVPLVVSYAPSETDELKRQTDAHMSAAMARRCPVRFGVNAKHQLSRFELAERESRLANAVFETVGARVSAILAVLPR